ncbi:N-acetylglucosamine-6-phosphate deacetylase [Parendozoicomonas sp. Alg238-R29]|uniref:N-acetylglucosamine-6-phosphate deacetylase n=1 Tax=Parendozoicomonas sp. Alg238-R29 TaxID=2993446 RepID=UPI00248ED11D|nr:N-acetylglucosamine-6-phosphate deacetylase [Parendozoicomonas sp. Alg238-R29]
MKGTVFLYLVVVLSFPVFSGSRDEGAVQIPVTPSIGHFLPESGKSYFLRSRTKEKKTNELCIAATEVLFGKTLVPDHAVAIRDGVIQHVFPRTHWRWQQCERKEAYTGILAPGFIDIHIHGANGRDVMDQLKQPDSLSVISTYLPEEGVTSWLPTTASARPRELSRLLSSISSYARSQPDKEAAIIGIHMEGPFISKEKKGCHHAESLRPISISDLNIWKESANDLLRIVTFAPELKQSDELIRWCTLNRVIASIGHTAAKEKQALRAIEQGAEMGTHLFNAMSMPTSRNAGVAFSILNHPKTAFEVIMDGHHLSDVNVQLAWKLSQENSERFVLITDAMSAKGVKNTDGIYTLGKDIQVVIRDGKALRADSDEEVLAGSIATMPGSVRTMRRITNCLPEQALLAGSYHPAKALGLRNRGLLQQGYLADMVLLSDRDTLSVIATWRGGQKIYTSHLLSSHEIHLAP